MKMGKQPRNGCTSTNFDAFCCILDNICDSTRGKVGHNSGLQLKIHTKRMQFKNQKKNEKALRGDANTARWL